MLEDPDDPLDEDAPPLPAKVAHVACPEMRVGPSTTQLYDRRGDTAS